MGSQRRHEGIQALVALIHGTVKLGGLVLETVAMVRLSAAYPEAAVNKLSIKAVVKMKSFKSILEYAKQKQSSPVSRRNVGGVVSYN